MAGRADLSHLKGFLIHEVTQAGGGSEHVIALHRRNNACKHRVCPLRVPDGEDAALRAHLLVRHQIYDNKAVTDSEQGGCTKTDACQNACRAMASLKAICAQYVLTSTAWRYALAALPKACRASRAL